VATVTVEEGRAAVRERVLAARSTPETESVEVVGAAGRVVAEDIAADRDYPPVARSIRDGFAVRSTDLPGRLTVIGEVRAGETFAGFAGPGQAVEIMTGAPLPDGADQVVMVEHVVRDGECIVTERAAAPGEFINPRGAEARAGEAVIAAGKRIGFPEVAWMSTVGRARVSVYGKPRVAILATGDEIVEVSATPRENQVRNSNSQSLAVQVARAGGVPEVLPIAPDEREATRNLIERGLRADLLLLSGGVSAGKYDLVETVLAELGAEFYFDRVKLQPGQPLVFGRARGTFFFGLPGNPASTMVTFEIFARLALELLGGENDPPFPVASAQLTAPFAHKPGLTRFLPARLCAGKVTPIPWNGSSDVPALVRGNAFLIADSSRERWEPGDWIGVLPR
jgi:molybdopterin molybdotransferase